MDREHVRPDPQRIARQPPPITDPNLAPQQSPPVVPASRSPSACVVLVPSGQVLDQSFEEALVELRQRGHSIRRVRQPTAPSDIRDRMVTDALAAGFSELLWVDPAVVFRVADIEQLRTHNLPFVCGVYPAPGWSGLSCEFPASTPLVRFGTSGGLQPVRACGLGFALVRRSVFEAIARQPPPGTMPTFFVTSAADANPAGPLAEDVTFCRRAQACGFEIMVDTSLRLWRMGRTRLSWEDVRGDRDRYPDFVLSVQSGAGPASSGNPPAERSVGTPATSPAAGPPTSSAQNHTESTPASLRVPARPLAGRFPRIRLYVVTYPANAASCAATLASVRASDWGEEPIVINQPTDWPTSRDSGSRNYKRALEAAIADECDLALILEDDVRVCRHLRHNLLANPLVQRDQCDYLSLFIPDLIADPWERSESHLGYRLAKPRYSGPNHLWERSRIWGSQGYLLSRRFLQAALTRWDRLTEGQDTRIISVCAEFQSPLWYTEPCLVNHAPVVSAFGTPDAAAPDFDHEFKLEVGAGFQPPESVPGRLTVAEAERLWRTAIGRDVLELGTASGRSTVCLAQSARRLVSVDSTDQAEAAEWVQRYGLADRVEFRRGNATEVCRTRGGHFDMVFIDTLRDTASVVRDITTARSVVAPGGLLAFHGYPDPGWPDVRRMVDDHVHRLGWKRIAQVGFLGIFQT